MVAIRQVAHYASAADRGPIIEVVSWILTVVAALAAIIKVTSKWILTRKISRDDYIISGSLLVAIAYVVVLEIQIQAGLGRNCLPTANEGYQVERFSKTKYTNEILYVTCLCATKMGLLVFLITLARNSKRRLAAKLTMGLTVGIFIIAVFALAFQCGLPHPWDLVEGTCFNTTAFWIFYGVFDLLTDIALVALPVYFLYDVQIQSAKRRGAILAFSTRTLLLPITVLRLIYIVKSSNSTNQPCDDYAIAIATTVHISMSIVTTCMPFMKPILEGLQSGIFITQMPGSGTDSHGHSLGRIKTKTTSSLQAKFAKVGQHGEWTRRRSVTSDASLIHVTTSIAVESVPARTQPA